MLAERSFPARLRRVVDADTIEVHVDHGFRIATVQGVRLLGINAPELNTAEGQTAKQFVVDWFAAVDSLAEWPLTLRSIAKLDKYGRRLGDIDADGSLTAALLAAGHATPASY